MRKTTRTLCGFTVAAGIFGAFFRWVQLGRAVEEDTGLFLPGAPSSTLMAVYLVVVAAVLLVLVRRCKGAAFQTSYPAVYAGGGRAVKPVAILAGILLAIGGLLTITHAMHMAKAATAGLIGTLDYTPVFDLLLGIFAIICGIAAIFFVFNAGSRKPGRAYFSSALIVLFLCFWLIAAYKYSADDPVLWNFAIRLLDISATILAFYYAAGFVYDKPRPLAALYFCQLSAFLGIVTEADVYPLGEQLIVLAFLILSLLLSALQLGSAGTHSPETPSAETE